MQKREGFGSKFGMLAVSIGSAVGLGNIWRFPYIVGQYGGGAFLIIYLIITAIIGIPLMTSELIIGRAGGKDAIGSFKKLDPDKPWYISGVLGVLTAFLILAYYGVVAGWTLHYTVSAATNSFAGKSPDEINFLFTSFISNPIKPIIYQLIFMFTTGFIVANGVQKGIEKISKLLVPLLLVLIIILDIKAISLPGGMKGLEFLFKPDFSKLDGRVFIGALGHAFYSLSLGMGIMITYGSYMDKNENIGQTALQISIADLVIALLAGIAIFPAVFAYGVDPTSGAGLVFLSLTNVFAQMDGGYIFGLLFFVLLSLAALTSTISLLEVVVAYLVDSFKLNRKKAAILATAGISFLGIFASLSQGVLGEYTIFGSNFFDFLDKLTANYFLPTAALISVLFLVKSFGRENIEKELTNNHTLDIGYTNTYYYFTKYLVPVEIILVFLYQMNIFGQI